MATTKGSVAVVLLIVVMIHTVASEGGTTVDCNKIQSALRQCVPYLTKGGAPGQPCCDAVSTLKGTFPSTAERRAACACVKKAAAALPSDPAIDENAAQLPQKCSVSIDFTISRKIDCSTIN